MSLKTSATAFLTKPSVQRFLWSLLRQFKPVLVIKKNVFISRYEDVTEVLKRDTDFTISEINGKRMEDMHLSFFLGMDRGDQHDREAGLMEKVMKREDMALIQKIVRNKSAEILETLNSREEIDLVGEYARRVPLFFISDYFGVPVKDEKKMMQWMRILFHHLFLNLSGDAEIASKAKAAADELKVYMEEVIVTRKKEVLEGKGFSDTILDRLLALQTSNPWITNDVIRRNICGNLIGAVDTTNKCTALTIDYLLEKPELMSKGQAAAVLNNIQVLGKIMLEVLRFNPHNPIVLRYAKNKAVIARRGKTFKIPENSTLYVGINSAMFDREIFTHPSRIDLERKTDYLHFSYGMHACSGRYINMVQIPELMAGLLRLKNLRRCNGERGKIQYEGPFPNKFVLQFDRGKSASAVLHEAEKVKV